MSRVLAILMALPVIGHFLTGYAFKQVKKSTSMVKLIK
jgi:hypothetical protein